VIETGWTAVPEELPAAREGRALADVLERARVAESPRDRAQRVAEERAVANRAAGGRDGDNRSFINRVLGRPEGRTASEVVQRFAATPDRTGPDASELRRARQILEQHGLDHLLPQRVSAVLDANCGYMGSPKYQPDVDLPRDVELGRMREELDAGRHWMRLYQDRLAVRSGKPRRPFGEARRSEPVTCEGCLQLAARENIPAEELPSLSFAIHHSDADGNPLSAPAHRPVRVPDDSGQRSARASREITRVAGEGQLGDVFGRVVA
jgi:hypothetical protein